MIFSQFNNFLSVAFGFSVLSKKLAYATLKKNLHYVIRSRYVLSRRFVSTETKLVLLFHKINFLL